MNPHIHLNFAQVLITAIIAILAVNLFNLITLRLHNNGDGKSNLAASYANLNGLSA